MDTSSSPSIPLIYLTINNEKSSLTTSYEYMTFHDDNVMKIFQPDIDIPISLSNQLFREEEIQNSSNSFNLEEEKELSNNKSA